MIKMMTSELNATVKDTEDPPLLPETTAGKSRAVVRNMADVKPEKVEWLWPGKIAIGKLTIIVGDPGLGKSMVTMALAAHVTTGREWPDDPMSGPPLGSVLILSAEDDPGDTIRPRLDAAGADPARVHTFVAVETFNDKGEKSIRSLSLGTDLFILEEAIARIGDVKMVIVDPISAYLGDVDSHKNAEVRALLAPLSTLASKHRIAMVVVTHLNKGSGTGNAIYRTTGSLGFVAAARAVYLVSRDPEDDNRRLMLPMKNNLASDTHGVAYSIQQAETGIPVVQWDSVPVQMSANEALRLSELGPGHRSEKDDAADWLREVLGQGPRDVNDLKEMSEEAGFSWSTLKRAKSLANVRSYKPRFEGGWRWELRDRREHEEPCPEKLVPLEEVDSLRENTSDSGVSQEDQNHEESQEDQEIRAGVSGPPSSDRVKAVL